jgi:hypothetical protein
MSGPVNLTGLIDPNWQVSDLDPVTWRNLGSFFDISQYFRAAQPGEHGLFILHDDGRLLKAVDTASPSIPADIPSHIDNPQILARDLYARGEWRRVHVINRRHLAEVAREAQATARRDLTMDAYYHLVYSLIWGDPQGYVVEPPRLHVWHGWTYADVEGFFADLPSPASLALGVYDGDALTIGLILIYADGMIRRVTTFEALDWRPPSRPGPTAETLTALRAALTTQFAPPAAILLAADAAFNAWLDAADKASYLAEAGKRAEALWYRAK